MTIAEAAFDEFEKPQYANVIMAPIYASFNHELGYGNVIDKPISGIYNNTIKTLANGADGVHPASGVGYIEEGNAYVGSFLEIANQI